jgi:hypothetical protein
MMTVQAPQAPWPQAALVPVNPSVSLHIDVMVLTIDVNMD